MVILIHFYIVYDRFHATKMELNNCDGDLLTKTPKIGTIMLFAENVFLIAGPAVLLSVFSVPTAGMLNIC